MGMEAASVSKTKADSMQQVFFEGVGFFRKKGKVCARVSL